MSNLERAISDALDDHAKAETRISRWEETLNAAIYNGIIDGLAEKTFVTERMKVSTAILASSLAQDFVDDLPNYLSRKANGASLDRTVYADALTPELATTIANKVVQKAIVGMLPIIRKREDDLRKMQPPMVSKCLSREFLNRMNHL